MTEETIKITENLLKFGLIKEDATFILNTVIEKTPEQLSVEDKKLLFCIIKEQIKFGFPVRQFQDL